jgi:hypothetical protein
MRSDWPRIPQSLQVCNMARCDLHVNSDEAPLDCKRDRGLVATRAIVNLVWYLSTRCGMTITIGTVKSSDVASGKS